MRPWSDRPIQDCLESLEHLPPQLFRIEPHPYASIGAPYGPGRDPFRLRSGVVRRLLEAQDQLCSHAPELQFAIFDAWRPISVQAFMVNYTIDQLCRERGVERHDPAQQAALHQVKADVARFWASPSRNPETPPPHSTGAAVDLTLATGTGALLQMGGDIDAIGAVSEPNYYANATKPEAQMFHQRRDLLRSVMASAGFIQHPNEWWHYSYGDQLWAWRSGAECAIYAEAGSRSATA